MLCVTALRVLVDSRQTAVVIDIQAYVRYPAVRQPDKVGEVGSHRFDSAGVAQSMPALTCQRFLQPNTAMIRHQSDAASEIALDHLHVDHVVGSIEHRGPRTPSVADAYHGVMPV